MLICITIGHAGRITKINDRGASYEGYEETSLVRRYTDAIDKALRGFGHTCILLSDGHYSEQWNRVNAYKADIYLNCHVNAGSGDYSLALYDYRSSKGKLLAESIGKEISSLLSVTSQSKPCKPDTNGTSRDSDFSEAYGCIFGVKAVALCLEPYFIDGPKRTFFIEHLDELGYAIAKGIDNYLKLN